MDPSPQATGAMPRPRLASLWFRRARSGDEALAAAAADDNDDEDRVKVMLRLSTKIRRVIASEEAIRTARNAAPSQDEYRRRDAELGEAVEERLYCDTRYSAIDAGQEFTDPGPAAETALLNAIDAVDRALQNTAAVEALLGAVHALVGAYPAASTEAAA